MKIIMLGATLDLLHQNDPTTCSILIANGEMKQTKNNIHYLILNQ